MDLVTAGLVGQLIAVLGLVVLVTVGPPDPRQAIRVREDGHTEGVDDERSRELWHLATRGLIALFACSALVGLTGFAKA